MIRDLRFIEEYRHLLDDHIPDQMVHYNHVLQGQGAPLSQHHHDCALQQATVWAAKLQNLLNNAQQLAAFQARYPDWTTANIQGVISSLQAIAASIQAQPMTAATVVPQHIQAIGASRT